MPPPMSAVLPERLPPYMVKVPWFIIAPPLPCHA